jgi:hypothetical protein
MMETINFSVKLSSAWLLYDLPVLDTRYIRCERASTGARAVLHTIRYTVSASGRAQLKGS